MCEINQIHVDLNVKQSQHISSLKNIQTSQRFPLIFSATMFYLQGFSTGGSRVPGGKRHGSEGSGSQGQVTNKLIQATDRLEYMRRVGPMLFAPYLNK